MKQNRLTYKLVTEAMKKVVLAVALLGGLLSAVPATVAAEETEAVEALPATVAEVTDTAVSMLTEAQPADVEPIKEAEKAGEESLDVKGIIFGHLGDGYEWHITTIGDTHYTLYLPVIVYSQYTGWHMFLSSHLHENHGEYDGLHLAPAGSRYEGKLVEYAPDGSEYRPWDISITKITLALFINSFLLIWIILSTARWYRGKTARSKAPKGFVGAMEMAIETVNNEVVVPCVGKRHRKFAPYLLTAFFFILLNNLMGLVPIFPGGATVTGNMAVTMVLALATFFVVNVFGTKHYWKDIVWPDVPWWLKAPFPLMPLIEFVGIFTKPVALMIRLFANMFAGHMAMLVLTCLIFIAVSMGPFMTGAFSFISVFFNIFMNLLELLVAFIQAYIFTMLSAVFIGMAQTDGEEEHAK